jgi:hypothetical protein
MRFVVDDRLAELTRHGGQVNEVAATQKLIAPGRRDWHAALVAT